MMLNNKNVSNHKKFTRSTDTFSCHEFGVSFCRLHSLTVWYAMVWRLNLDWSFNGNYQEIVPVLVLDNFWLISHNLNRIHIVRRIA